VKDKKKPSRTFGVADIAADNPDGTMERFADGLRRVIAAGRRAVTHQRPKRGHLTLRRQKP